MQVRWVDDGIRDVRAKAKEPRLSLSHLLGELERWEMVRSAFDQRALATTLNRQSVH
jgi:hypothetical protein